MEITKTLAERFGLNASHAQNLVNLLDEGCTIPFIARYRKEMHGSCDDQKIREFADSLEYLRNLEKRKTEVTKLLTEQGNLTPEIEQNITKAVSLTEIEDIYRPFRPKRKTRASVAIAAGLKPLADNILANQRTKLSSFEELRELAQGFLNVDAGIDTPELALGGAADIIAEMVADDPELRKALREIYWAKSKLHTEWREDKDENKVFEMYKDRSENIRTLPSHRILAINRGEKLDALKVNFMFDPEAETVAEKAVLKSFVPGDISEFLSVNAQNKSETDKNKQESLPIYNSGRELTAKAALDGYKRLLTPSLERELRAALFENAAAQAIKIFEMNLEHLLMQPPLKGKTILAVDPAYRTGCKIAVIDPSGKVLDTGVVYPTPPQSKIEESERVLTGMIEKHGVDTISIGNGTASKEAEIFVANLIKKLSRKVNYAVVNEAGASVYSASKLGAQEFPQYDVSIRSAVSIARRLQDPLAELIKIDPKSIGVGQYQHDMPQKQLGQVLEGVVEKSVNEVGVDLNTASVPLLSRVSGLNATVAKNIAEYRNDIKAFKSREQLTQVPHLGAKAFEQCAGFLRIPGAQNILDNTAVHPESYGAALKLLKHFKLDESAVGTDALQMLTPAIEKEGWDNVAKVCGVGTPTLQDIVTELLKPGRDIRDSLPQPILRSDLLSLDDLEEGMELMGTVRNVIDFGAFVDIGVHQDGLVHISEICDRFIKHPSEELSVGDAVKVKVIGVDKAKKRISLSIKQAGKD